MQLRWVLIAAFFFPSLVMAENVCPSSFDEFLSRFERTREFQQENIIYPLKYSFIDSNANPEPKTVNKRLSKTDVAARKEPIYPSPRDQKAVPLAKELHKHSQVKKSVRLYKPDTGYVLEYHFKKIGECWKLAMFEDLSI